MTNPDRACLHLEFSATVNVARIAEDPEQPPTAYMAEIQVSCEACGEPFRFTGLQAGSHFGKPMVSPDETELRAPMRPASSDPDFGMGLPGFAITYRPAGD